MSAMTLKEARDLCNAWGDVPMSNVHMPSLYLRRVRDAIDAHLAQPAQAVDVHDLCHELYAMAQGPQPISEAVTAMEGRLTRALMATRAAVAELIAASRDAAAVLQDKAAPMEQETPRRLFAALARVGGAS